MSKNEAVNISDFLISPKAAYARVSNWSDKTFGRPLVPFDISWRHVWFHIGLKQQD